ncbi:MAG: hypothetical protein HY820_24695 [Acidobacteria bacterium]|nr:hypothetical protein [Acidobacteriota bacterium]
MKHLIIAIGNPLRGEDNVAHEAALKAPSDATVLHVIQLTPELAAEFPGYDTVVFLDADTGAPLEVAVATGPLSHHCSPQYIVALARCLYEWQGEAHVRGIPACQFD